MSNYATSSNVQMEKLNTATTAAVFDTFSPASPDSSKNEKKKRSIIPKIFGSKKSEKLNSDEDLFKLEYGDGALDHIGKGIATRRKAFMESSPTMQKCLSERQSSSEIQSLNLSNFEPSMTPINETKTFRVFAATWNVGGKYPNNSINLEDFLQVEDSADIYVIGFQEIVPLNAGNVLVIEDNEPAAKWLEFINQAINKPKNNNNNECDNACHGSKTSSKDSKTLPFFQKPSLKVLSRHLRPIDGRLLKTCNCPIELGSKERRLRKLSEDSTADDLGLMILPDLRNEHASLMMDRFISISELASSRSGDDMKYKLISSKQMVGLFLSVWTKQELIPHIGHLRVSTVGRGILGRLGNKGCISISMSVHETSFCFICSHLASGEKEGDELKRNADASEILKNTQFNKICKKPNKRAPERIMDHDRIIWLGDLNYRMSLSYEDTKILIEDNDWDRLLEKDQLNVEREAGRAFSGFSEGRIQFAPTYKYNQNSDSYAGETVKSKKKRRTPSWCDRILWRGNGIEQLCYIRGESRLSDHRPVCGVFWVPVEMRNRSSKFRKGYSCAAPRLPFEDCVIPKRHSFYEF